MPEKKTKYDEIIEFLKENTAETSEGISKNAIPNDMELLQDVITSLYIQFRHTDGKQKTRIIDLLLSALDLKWKYLGLEKTTKRVDSERLKEALKKAGVTSPEDILQNFLKGGEEDGSQEEAQESQVLKEGDDFDGEEEEWEDI